MQETQTKADNTGDTDKCGQYRRHRLRQTIQETQTNADITWVLSNTQNTDKVKGRIDNTGDADCEWNEQFSRYSQYKGHVDTNKYNTEDTDNAGDRQ